jgi:hypothetical protein
MGGLFLPNHEKDERRKKGSVAEDWHNEQRAVSILRSQMHNRADGHFAR